MIAAQEIHRRAAALIREYGTCNPFALARALHVEVLVCELGTLRGFYKDIYGSPFIFLSFRLRRTAAKQVCAHELGHHLLHRQFATSGFEEASIFSHASRREYEANLFAAELLLDTKLTFSAAKQGYTVAQIATKYGTDVRLVQMKLYSMGLFEKYS